MPTVNRVTTTTRPVTEGKPLASPVSAHDHHSHAGGVCPVTGLAHVYCPPQPNDKRSPCPALNTLANHGFLPRNGRNIGPFAIFQALREGYHLSWILAFILAFGGWFVLGQLRKVSLRDLARHNCIEHDASLFHLDAHREDEYAPSGVNKSLMRSALHQGGRYLPGQMTLEDVANIRVRREAALSMPLRWWQAELARGEMAVAIGILGGMVAHKNGVDIEVLRLWVSQERLPDDWKPDHTQGLFKTVSMVKVIRDRMKAMTMGQMDNILDDERDDDERSPIVSPSDVVPSSVLI